MNHRHMFREGLDRLVKGQRVATQDELASHAGVILAKSDKHRTHKKIKNTGNILSKPCIHIHFRSGIRFRQENSPSSGANRPQGQRRPSSLGTTYFQNNV